MLIIALTAFFVNRDCKFVTNDFFVIKEKFCLPPGGLFCIFSLYTKWSDYG